MTDTERLAALLHEEYGHKSAIDILCYCSAHAARLVAAGVRIDLDSEAVIVAHMMGYEDGKGAARIDPDRLARALSSVTGEYSGISDDLAAAIVKAYEEEG